MICPITKTELKQALAQGIIKPGEYIKMLPQFKAYEPRPDCIDWMAEEGDR